MRSNTGFDGSAFRCGCIGSSCRKCHRIPLVIYTAAVDPAHLPCLVDGQRVLFLAERSTGAAAQDRIVGLPTGIGAGQELSDRPPREP
jgi:hypothetical protein